ncbi:aminodeoxychorismate synthase component I [Dichotomicrobium thermohalophilum]|uniref:Para-aminobenzoate synthetase component 1 n=1 Tax=Dichotomicrobium thermohalophilum TaxID=933063 RepID=A0A397QC38_9HYPH|nr:aminodeoxychorismate synthase component I [Dichotomicrobium thermohalophilum]RIA55811.1 para-aminobenzoate synthetase component 1 [Dichotomicrobium thermohalophilum]
MTPFILFDKGPGAQPALFRDPLRIIEANTPEEVAPALTAIGQAQRAGRWLAGFASYELGYVLEPSLCELLPSERRTPLLRFGVFDVPGPAADLDPTIAHQAGEAMLRDPVCDWSDGDYADAFDVIRVGIAAGDYYQVNLTMRLRMRLEGTPLGLYGALRRRNPVAHGAYVDLGPPILLSRSPELFLEITRDGIIRTVPMKGTAPRGTTAAEDEALREQLQTDPKNRAENLMIVDLLRNDISRIAEPGTVHVPKLFKVESYQTVHQMISCVAARLRADAGIGDVFASLFPCGSVTGAPKIAAMRAIRDVEIGPREAYCGAIGWLAPDGRARFNVAIRTLMHYADDDVVLNVGGGVVADSTAESEYEEALWKTRFALGLPQT